MGKSDYNLGIKLSQGDSYPSGIAYIVIPSDIDRDKYIRECFKTSTVSIFSEHNGYHNRVPIDIMSLNFLEFPTLVNEFGSAVHFTVEKISNRPIINGIYNKADTISDLKEHQFRFKRELNGKYVELVGSPDSNYIGLNVKSDKGGEVFINVLSDDLSGKLNVSIAGEINITALGNTNIKQYGKLSITTLDSNDEKQFSTLVQDNSKHTFFDEEHEINTGKFSVNNGEQPLLLGKIWKEVMDKLIEEVANATVSTAIGQQPLSNKQQILAFKKETEKILSKISYIDK